MLLLYLIVFIYYLQDPTRYNKMVRIVKLHKIKLKRQLQLIQLT